MQNIQFDPEATVKNILLADKFSARHLIYAERKLLDEGRGIHAVARLVQERYGVTPVYAKALVAKILTQTYLAR